MRFKTFFYILSILLLCGNFCGGVFAQKTVALDIEQLDFANGLIQRGLYEMAIAEYEKFFTSFPASKFENPIIEFIGVLISCEIFDKNADFNFDISSSL